MHRILHEDNLLCEAGSAARQVRAYFRVHAEARKAILTLILLAGALRAQTASVKQAQQVATEQYLRTRDYSSLQEHQKRSQEEWLRSDFVRKPTTSLVCGRGSPRSRTRSIASTSISRRSSIPSVGCGKLKAGLQNNSDNLHNPRCS